jgi:shikimate dehydrogenase
VTSDIRLVPDIDNYAVMGNPVAHSKSPLIHQAFAIETGQRLLYHAILVPVGGFDAALAEFRRQRGKGLNITVPFKEDACQAMDRLTPRAELAGAVNTIWFDADGRRCGDTTDGAGLVRDLARLDIELEGRSLLILGAGGAVRGVLGDVMAQRPASLLIVNRTPARALELRDRFSSHWEIDVCGFEELQRRGRFDVVINAIPAGLTATLPPLPDDLARDSDCYDMVYGDTATPFVAWARKHGARSASDGLGMLVEQAAESFYIWRGVRPQTEPVIEMLRKGSE